MELGIMGLPQSGKSTVLQALTRGHVSQRGEGGAAHGGLGVIKVPDPRLEALAHLLRPRRTVFAELTCAEVGGSAAGLGKGSGWSGPQLNLLSRVEALIHVVRAFEDPKVPHVEGRVDPDRDGATMHLELAFADLAILERRLERLAHSLKGAKPAERARIQQEQALLGRLRTALEADHPLREQSFSREEEQWLASFSFLTAKPLLLLLNLGEEQLQHRESLEVTFRERHKAPGCEAIALCGQLERELAELSEEEAGAFRESLALGEPPLRRVLATIYALLNLITFFTIASDEVRAWTIPRGTYAPQAAGKIHSDMERGFIRGEVISWEELVRLGSVAVARHQGKLRLEGKSYVVQDGDVITFLFNV